MKKVWCILGVIFLGMLAASIAYRIVEAIVGFLALSIFYPPNHTQEWQTTWVNNVNGVITIFGILCGAGAWYYVYYLLIGRHKKRQDIELTKETPKV